MDPIDPIDGRRIGCIIQARLDSTRLCHKVLREIGDKTVLGHVIDAAIDSNTSWDVIVTTPDLALSRLALSYRANRYGMPVFSQLWRGNRDPLAEYYQAAKAARLDLIVRLTADCPMITGPIIDAAIAAFLAEDVDIYYNGLDGADVEVFTMAALERAYREATLPEEREHVTLFMKRHLRYKEGTPSAEDKAWYKSLDTPEDFRLIAERMGAAEKRA